MFGISDFFGISLDIVGKKSGDFSNTIFEVSDTVNLLLIRTIMQCSVADEPSNAFLSILVATLAFYKTMHFAGFFISISDGA